MWLLLIVMCHLCLRHFLIQNLIEYCFKVIWAEEYLLLLNLFIFLPALMVPQQALVLGYFHHYVLELPQLHLSTLMIIILPHLVHRRHDPIVYIFIHVVLRVFLQILLIFFPLAKRLSIINALVYFVLFVQSFAFSM